MKLELNITNSEGNQDDIDPDIFAKIKGILEQELKILMPASENYQAAEIALTFMDSEGIRELNNTYRNVDEPTDVLSFPMNDDDELENNFMPVLILGDIVICESEMMKLHPELNRDEALCLMIAHSFLHLLGYDHDTDEKQKVMWKIQDGIKNKMLAKINNRSVI